MLSKGKLVIRLKRKTYKDICNKVTRGKSFEKINLYSFATLHVLAIRMATVAKSKLISLRIKILHDIYI